MTFSSCSRPATTLNATPASPPAHALRASRHGSVLIFTTLWLFVVFAVAALSVDAGDWYYTRFQEQSAADAAAIAGAVTLAYPNATSTDACTAATAIAAQNGFNTGNTACTSTGNGYTVTITPDTATQTVTAAISQTGPIFFSIAFGLISTAPTIAAQATASIQQDSSNPVCILALNGQAIINLLNITIRNCTIASNAPTVDAVQLSLAQVSYIHSLYSAGGICMVGTPSCQPNLLGELTTATGIQALLNDLLLSFQTPPQEFQLPVNNPFAPLNTMAFTAPAHPAPQITGVTLNLLLLKIQINVTAIYYPGTYNNTLATNALVTTFEPGTYILKNGLDIEGPGLTNITAPLLSALGISPNLIVSGQNVTFVVSGGTVQIGANPLSLGVGTSLITLTAPAVNSTSGALNGVLFDITSPVTTSINLGDVLNDLQGVIYAPNAPVSLGLVSVNLTLNPNPCEIVVAQSVTLPTAQVAINLPTSQAACQSDGVTIPYPQYVELTQ